MSDPTDPTVPPDPTPGSGAPSQPMSSPSTPAAQPTPSTPPASTSSSWPSQAKATTAVLAIVALAAIAAAIIGFSRDSSSNDDSAVDDTAVDEDSAAIARAEAAEQERDDLAAQLAESEDVVATVTAERDEAVAASDQLTTDLAAETERADAAEAVLEELQAIAGQFPIGLDSSLIPDDMPGTYTITYQEAYCDGFSTCGTLPSVNQARVYFDSNQFLRIEVPGILDAGLFALEGSLYGITDSLTALPPCGGADTLARVTITMYAGAISVADDATRTVSDVQASITIDASQNGPDCPSGLVFYASRLTPTG